MNFNKVLIGGNLTRDVEIRQAGSSSVGSFGLAINHRFRTKEGEAREDTTFVDCEAWGKTAETMAQYLRKGRPVFIEGRLKLEQWEDKDGGKRSKMKVVVDSFQFVGGKDDAAPAPARSGGVKSNVRHEPVDESSIPF